MPERPARPPEEEGWRDIGIYDLARAVGAMVNFVSDVAAQLGTAVNQPRTPAARPLNAQRAQPPMRPEVPGGREPLVDLFDEGEEIVLVVEWADGDADLLEVSVQDDVLAISFGAGAPTVELLLPAIVAPSSLRQRARNGIAEIRLRRA